MKDLRKYRGCLLGGAVGDALGFPVEFLSDEQIFRRYSENGITKYELYNGIAEISDDTQMTLFTANGLLLEKTRRKIWGIIEPYADSIAQCYDDWLITQSYPPKSGYRNNAWLTNVPELHHERAPGRTCISALRSGQRGAIGQPINDSKGCGGVMRVAPIGLYFADESGSDETDLLGAQAAALTHGHELGYIPAAALVHIINYVTHREHIDLRHAVDDALDAVKRLFPNTRYLPDFIQLMEKACLLSKDKDLDDLEGIRSLGEGWVADETLAIAVYCSLKHQDNFEKGIVAAVNHSGDSDSTGSVTGNILGAFLGSDNIPDIFLSKLELKQVIMQIADDLFYDCQTDGASCSEDGIWEHKYLYCDYLPL